MFTWSLEVDSAELHRVGGMVGRHGFAAGKTALPALGLGPFPGIKQPHDNCFFFGLPLHSKEVSHKEMLKKVQSRNFGKHLESPTRLLGESKQGRHYCSNPNLHEVLERILDVTSLELTYFRS